MAAIAVAVAAAARFALEDALGDRLPYITFFPAIALAALIAGGRAALATTVMSLVFAEVMVLRPAEHIRQPSHADYIGAALFLMAGVLISAIAGILTRARERERAEAERRRAAEEEALQSRDRIAADLEAMTRLQEISTLFVREGGLEPVLGTIVEAAREIAGADFGNIQLLDERTGELRIVAQQGFQQPFLDFWNRTAAGEGSCGTAMQSCERVVVEDIEQSPIFAGTLGLQVLRQAGVRAVQSTRLVSRSGMLVGVFSTHYRKPQRPDGRALRLLDLLARQAADIIEQAQTHEALRARRAELELILSRTPFMLTRCSRDLRYLYVSHAYAEMLGRKPEEVAGRPIMEIIGPKGFETIRPHIEAVLRGEPVEYEAMVEFKGLGPRLLSVGYVSERDERGQVVGWVASIVDLTERQRAREALRRSEEQFRTLADSMPNLAWWAGPDGSITWYNQRWYEYTGKRPAQVLGSGWQCLHDPQLLPEVLERWAASISGGQPFEMEFPLRGADGRSRWFLTRVVPVRDGNGRVRRWFGTNTDITEIREARLVLKRSNEELQKLVEARTARLQELVAELEHFSYTITHDMRAPLRALRGFAEVINEADDDWSAADQKRFVRRIITAAERMDLLITDALNYSKAVRQELPLGPLDVGALVRGMLESYPEFQSTHADIRVEGELPPVIGNEAALTQCFSNLLANAVKFAAPDRKPQVRVWAERRDDWVRLWVEDNGIGISETMRPRVFDLFSRGASARAGTGIGLALVRKVVDRMGGRVGVESEEGKGSRFWVELRPEDAGRALTSGLVVIPAWSVAPPGPAPTAEGGEIQASAPANTAAA